MKVSSNKTKSNQIKSNQSTNYTKSKKNIISNSKLYIAKTAFL